MQLPTWRSWQWHVQMLGGGFTFGELSSFNVLAVLAKPDALTVITVHNLHHQFAGSDHHQDCATMCV